MSKYFLFMPVEPQIVRDYLNLAIFLLNPQERWPAHVTIAGPFQRPIDIPRSLRFQQQVFVLGPGRFENGARKVVFLHVVSKDLHAHIAKPDFPDAVPHMTLYSGRDVELANLLYARLRHMPLHGVLNSTALQVVKAGEKHTIDLKLQVKTELPGPTKGKSLVELRKLSSRHRVAMATTVAQIALDLSRRLSSEAPRLPSFIVPSMRPRWVDNDGSGRFPSTPNGKRAGKK